MLVVPEHQYPLICIAVSKGTELNQVVQFETLNPNSISNWFDSGGYLKIMTPLSLNVIALNCFFNCLFIICFTFKLAYFPVFLFFGILDMQNSRNYCCYFRYPTELRDPCDPAGERYNFSLLRS